MKKALLVLGFLSSMALVSEGHSLNCKLECTAKLGEKTNITEGNADFNKIKECLKGCKTKSYVGSLDQIKNFLGALLKNTSLSAKVRQELAASFVDYKDQHIAMDDLKKIKGTTSSQLFNDIEKEADKFDSLKQLSRSVRGM